MKTPDEIKKGIALCMRRVCALQECPYYREESCSTAKSADALALIQQLEAQVTALVAGGSARMAAPVVLNEIPPKEENTL